MNKTIKFKREPSKGELRYIVSKIWGLDVDYEQLKECEELEPYYNDIKGVLTSKMTIDTFSVEYTGDSYDELFFSIIHNTLMYLLKRGVI